MIVSSKMSMTHSIHWAIASLLTIMLFSPIGCRATVFNVKSYGARGDGITDDTKAIQTTINAAISAGPGNEVYLPSANYLLASDTLSKNEELDVFLSKNLTIQGDTNAALIVPSSVRNIFYLWADNGLTIKNLSLRRTQRMFTQVIINSIDKTKDTVVATIMQGYDQMNASNLIGTALLLVYSNPNSHTWGDHQKDCGFFAPNNTSVCWPPTVIGRKQLSPTQWELTLNTTPQQNYIGSQAVAWVNSGGGMAFVATASGNVVVQDTQYYASGADAGWYLAGNTGSFTFNNFTMDVVPGSKDLISAAGGSYSLNNHTTLTVENSRIVGVWDDCINIGSNSARVFDVANSNTIDVDGSRANFAVGDVFGIWDWTYKSEYQRQTAVAQAVSCASGVCRITFDRPIKIKSFGHGNSFPEDQDGIDRVIDVNSAGNLSVLNSTFQSLHARDIVARSSNVRVSDNKFKDTVGPAVYLGFDFGCDEGPAPSNIVITGNEFSNISSSNILIGTEGDGTTFSNAENDITGINISNNVFGGVAEFSQGAIGNPHAPVMMRAAVSAQMTGNFYSPFSPTFTILPQGIDYASTSFAKLQNNTTISAAQYNTIMIQSK